MELILLLVCVGSLVLYFVGKPMLDKHDAGQLDKRNQWLAATPDFDAAVRTWTGPSVAIAIDADRSRFGVFVHPVRREIYRFDQLIAVEVERNGVTVTRTKRGRQAMGAAAGAALLGPAGLLLGGLSAGKTSQELLSKASLKIFTSDLNMPMWEIGFFNNPNGVSPTSPEALNAATLLDQWHGRLRAIVETRTAGADGDE